MAGTITTGNHPKALWPGMHAFFGLSYNEQPAEWSQIFTVEKSSKNYEEDTLGSGFGLAPIKTEGGSVSYDSETQGFTKRYTHVVYGLGWIVTDEEMEDNLYEILGKRRTNNPLLVGEPGVGKTAIVEGIAQLDQGREQHTDPVHRSCCGPVRSGRGCV